MKRFLIGDLVKVVRDDEAPWIGRVVGTPHGFGFGDAFLGAMGVYAVRPVAIEDRSPCGRDEDGLVRPDSMRLSTPLEAVAFGINRDE